MRRVNKDQELAGLKTQLQKYEGDLEAARQGRSHIDKNITRLERLISGLEKQIKQLTEETKELIVTDHAALRYLERFYGWEPGSLKQQIAKSLTVTNRNCRIKKNGLTFIIKNNCLVTVK